MIHVQQLRYVMTTPNGDEFDAHKPIKGALGALLYNQIAPRQIVDAFQLAGHYNANLSVRLDGQELLFTPADRIKDQTYDTNFARAERHCDYLQRLIKT